MKALFLDRDGVVNIDTGYAHKVSYLRLVAGIIELITFFRERSYLIIVVSNQSGIGRGYFKSEDVSRFNSAINMELKRSGCQIDKFYFCPHKPLDNGRESCGCRKPRTGMLKKAETDFNIDLSKSLLIGDNVTDILAAFNANLDRAYLLSQKRSEHLRKIEYNFRYVKCLKDVVCFERKLNL